LSFNLQVLGVSAETRLASATIIQPVTPFHRFKHHCVYSKRQSKSRVELTFTDPAVAFQHPA
jgi:hypothetical protein